MNHVTYSTPSKLDLLSATRNFNYAIEEYVDALFSDKVRSLSNLRGLREQARDAMFEFLSLEEEVIGEDGIPVLLAYAETLGSLEEDEDESELEDDVDDVAGAEELAGRCVTIVARWDLEVVDAEEVVGRVRALEAAGEVCLVPGEDLDLGSAIGALMVDRYPLPEEFEEVALQVRGASVVLMDQDPSDDLVFGVADE